MKDNVAKMLTENQAYIAGELLPQMCGPTSHLTKEVRQVSTLKTLTIKLNKALIRI